VPNLSTAHRSHVSKSTARLLADRNTDADAGADEIQATAVYSLVDVYSMRHFADLEQAMSDVCRPVLARPVLFKCCNHIASGYSIFMSRAVRNVKRFILPLGCPSCNELYWDPLDQIRRLTPSHIRRMRDKTHYLTDAAGRLQYITTRVPEHQHPTTTTTTTTSTTTQDINAMLADVIDLE